ncbi:MAG: PrpF family protein [Candidatus Rokubacteria bacterium]|nr:PrpF family protein [Candidatus Rokubacteria bacterium]
MTQRRIPAVYMRGGTSRCLVFHDKDLPHSGPARDRILLSALGSPDPFGRQLNGIGGGISSLSKACIIGPSTHPDAQIDYTFAQIEVKSPKVDYTGNCGNCSSAVGPFAIDEGLVEVTSSLTKVRFHNTNTKKVIVAHVPVKDGEAAVEGDFELAGVAGRGARIALDFLDPGGAGTGRLLPTGQAREVIDGVEASLVDATNPTVFVRAKDLGISGTETPMAIDADTALIRRLERIRVEAGRRMGIVDSAAQPKIALVATPTSFTALDGAAYESDAVDVVARAMSMGNCHRAIPLTVSMCLAVAARITGSVVHEALGGATAPGIGPTHGTPQVRGHSTDVRLGHPSGILPIDATVTTKDGAPWAEKVTVYRTARRLMEGFVRVP